MERWISPNHVKRIGRAHGRRETHAGADDISLWTIIWQWKGSILLGSLMVSIFTFVMLLQVTPVYRATTQVILGSPSTQVNDIPNLAPDTPANAALSESVLIVMKSSDVLRAVVKDLRLDERDEFNPALRTRGLIDQIKSWVSDNILAQLTQSQNSAPNPDLTLAAKDPLSGTIRGVRSAVFVKVMGESYVIEVAAQSSSPRLAANISDAIAETYLALQIEAQKQAGAKVIKWLDERVVQLRGNLAASEQRVAQFRSGLINAGEDMADDFAPRLTELNAQIARLTTEQSDLVARRDEISVLFAASNYVALSQIVTQPAISDLFTKLNELESLVIELKTRHGEHPGIARANENFDLVEQRLVEQITRMVSGLNVRIDVVAARRDALETLLQTTRQDMVLRRQNELTLLEYEREADASREVYSRFLLQLKDARERGQFQSPDASIISKAEVPIFPVSPQKAKLSVVAGIGGGALVLAFAVLAGHANIRVKDPLHVAMSSGGATVHQLPNVQGEHTPTDLLRWSREPSGANLAEAVHWIRLRLMRKYSNRANVIVVTSAGHGDGKSTLSLLLAEAFDVNGYSTVLVNADPCSRGLSKLVASKEYEMASFDYFDYSDEAMRTLETQDGFQGSLAERLRTLKRTDFIIVDGPVALSSPEFVEFGLLADHVVVACAWNQTTAQDLNQCVDDLRDEGVPVSAIAINKVPWKSIEGATARPAIKQAAKALPLTSTST